PGGDRGRGNGDRGGGYRRQIGDEALPLAVAIGVEPADGAVADERAGHVVDRRRPARAPVAGHLLGGVGAAEVAGADDVILGGDPGLLVPGGVGVLAAGNAASDPSTGHRPGYRVRIVADPEELLGAAPGPRAFSVHERLRGRGADGELLIELA